MDQSATQYERPCLCFGPRREAMISIGLEYLNKVNGRVTIVSPIHWHRYLIL
jgi:hypothetical protein